MGYVELSRLHGGSRKSLNRLQITRARDVPVHARIGVHIQMSNIDTCPAGELKLPDPCQNDHRINITLK